MNASENADLRSVVAAVLELRTGANADLLAVARRTYDDLAGVLVPLIGNAGFEALASRALHVSQRRYPDDPAKSAPGAVGTTDDELVTWLGQLDQRLARDAAASMLAELGGLLGTFIGESLTTRLLRKAWPDAFRCETEEETHP
jgi:hypothetical protein